MLGTRRTQLAMFLAGMLVMANTAPSQGQTVAGVFGSQQQVEDFGEPLFQSQSDAVAVVAREFLNVLQCPDEQLVGLLDHDQFGVGLGFWHRFDPEKILRFGGLPLPTPVLSSASESLVKR